MLQDPPNANFVDAARRLHPRLAIVLGSGLGTLTDSISVASQVPYGDVPGLTAPSIDGHQGKLVLGALADQPVLVFTGRVHFYEGHPWRHVVESIHIAHRLGVDSLLVTNAAGGIRDDLHPGRLMALEAHLDCTRPFPWTRRSEPYSPRLLELLDQASRVADVPLTRGVYAQVTGPCYETPAEIRALRAAGADAVGMSTAREIEVAASLGLECAALSCITNKAAGLCDGPIHHQEVLTTTKDTCGPLTRLVTHFVGTMHDECESRPAWRER